MLMVEEGGKHGRVWCEQRDAGVVAVLGVEEGRKQGRAWCEHRDDWGGRGLVAVDRLM